jgi:hypothetical protein
MMGGRGPPPRPKHTIRTMARPKKSASSNLSSLEGGDEVLVSAKWPDDRPDDSSEIISRALQVIGLEGSPSQSASYRKYIAESIFCIKLIGSGREALPPRKRKKELRTLVETLRKAIPLLTREAKLALFIRLIPREIKHLSFPLQIQPAYPCSDDHFRYGLNALLGQLEEIASEAEELSRQIEIRRGSPPPDMMKVNAAIAAYRLMCKVEITPTLTDQGQYYNLAAVFYEGATGIADADLSRSCRLVYHDKNLRN